MSETGPVFIGECRNNNLRAVIGAEGVAIVRGVHARAHQLEQLHANEGGTGYFNGHDIAWSEAKTFDVATFCHPDAFDDFKDVITGTYADYDILTEGCQIVDLTFGVPFSNLFFTDGIRERDSIITVPGLRRIFGDNVKLLRPIGALA